MRFSRDILNCILNKNNLTKSIHQQSIPMIGMEWKMDDDCSV